MPDRWLQAQRELSKKDPVMKKLLTFTGPCPLKPRRKHFFHLCQAIVSQQLSTKAAKTIWNRFNELYPQGLNPQDLLKTSDRLLRKQGLSSQKTSYLKDLAQKIETRELKLNFSQKHSDQEIIENLTQVKGIGQWTAEMFLMFSLARPDVFSAGDLGLRQALVNLYDLKNREDYHQASKIAEVWQPWRTLASWALWRSLEIMKPEK